MNSEYEVVHVYHYASHYMYCKEDGYVYFKSFTLTINENGE